MTREQFEKEIRGYLYSKYDADIVDKELEKRIFWFDRFFDEYLTYSDKETYLQQRKYDFGLLCYTPTKEQFKEEVRIRLYNNPRCVGKKDKIDKLLNEDVDNILEDNYDNAINDFGFFHGVNDAAYEFRICYF